jgi:hypothetical protein
VQLDNFARLFTDSLYIRAYLTSIWNAGDRDGLLPADRLPDGARHDARLEGGATCC